MKADVTTGFEPVCVRSTRVFVSYQSSVAHVPIHAAGFAMLSLAPVMDLDVSS
jgi:hypothetical protein